MKTSTIVCIYLPKYLSRTFVCTALALAFTFASAKANPSPLLRPVYKAAFASTITSFLPAGGSVGTLVTVKGSGFTAASTLAIGGKEAIVVSFTTTQIVGMVMPGAVTGKVVIDGVSSATDFKVNATPYPGLQQGPKLIDSLNRDFGLYAPLIAPGQGHSVVLSADGNAAIVNGTDGAYLNYLFYTRTDGKWKVSSAFKDGFGTPGFGNNLGLSADGNTAIVGQEFLNSLPAKLYRRKNGVWAAAGTLSDSAGSSVGLSADGKTAILGKRIQGGGYSGGQTPLGITIMKLIDNTWQPQQVEDVPYTFEMRRRFVRYNDSDYDEDGNLIPEPIYYELGTAKPGNLVAISADGKTAASSSFALNGRYDGITLGYTVIYGLTATGWKVQAKLPQSNSISLSADGNTFLIDNNVYTRSGTTWGKQQQLPNAGGAISADGNTIFFAGLLPVAYVRSGNTWVQKEVAAPNPAPVFDVYYDPAFATALSADGTTAFVGVADDRTRTAHNAPLGSVTVYGVDPYNPLDYAAAISFLNTTDKSTTLTWPRGNGTINRAVFLKMGTAGLPATVKGTAYAADSSFAKGDLVATGWYCVYNGTGGHVNITGLKTGTTYTASVVEYTGSTGAETYQVTGTTTRVTTPFVAPDYPTNIVVNEGKNPATMMGIKYSTYGPMPVGFAIFVKDLGYAYPNDNKEIPTPGIAYYAANSKFGAGEQIGNSGWFCVYNGAYLPEGVSVTSLRPGAYYRIVAVAYNGSKTIPVYTNPDYVEGSGATWRTNAFDPPTGYATALTFSNTTATSSTLSWINGTGASRAVFIKAGSLGAPVPVDGYLPDASNPYTQGQPLYQESGNQDWYCVYTGTGSSVNLLGLSPSTTYRVAVVDYNGGEAPIPVAFVKRFNGANVTTAAPIGAPATPPTGYATALIFSNTAATSTTLSWASSNGTKRAVFLKLGTSGALNVVQGQTYTGNAIFKLGSQAGTNGWYCVYNGTGSSVNISGLNASGTYRAIVIEYNGSAGAEGYNLSRYNGANVTTLSAPLMFASLNKNQADVLRYTGGEPAAQELIIHQGVSANGDGVNDVFTIDGITAYPENTVKVMNSNGEVIYTADGYNNSGKAFNGHASNGMLQKAGTYFYSLEYKKGTEAIRKTGYLVLKY